MSCLCRSLRDRTGTVVAEEPMALISGSFTREEKSGVNTLVMMEAVYVFPTTIKCTA